MQSGILKWYPITAIMIARVSKGSRHTVSGEGNNQWILNSTLGNQRKVSK